MSAKPQKSSILGVSLATMNDPTLAASLVFAGLESLRVQFPTVHATVVQKLIDAGQVRTPLAFL